MREGHQMEEWRPQSAVPFIILTYKEVIWGGTTDAGDLPQRYGAPMPTRMTGLGERILSMVYGITPTHSPHENREDTKSKS